MGVTGLSMSGFSASDPRIDRLEAALRRHAGLARLLDGMEALGLPDAWLVAGCVAQSLWNALEGAPAGAGMRDADLVYCDPAALSAAEEARQEARVRALFPLDGLVLDVKNQARVHLWYEAKFGRAIAPWTSSAAAIGSYPSTATAIGVRMRGGRFEVCAPFGLDDLFGAVIRPNRLVVSRAVYEAKAARWRAQWPTLSVVGWACGKPLC